VEERESAIATRVRTPNRLACSESLYRTALSRTPVVFDVRSDLSFEVRGGKRVCTRILLEKPGNVL
jgi:hypothetical protein